MLAAGITTMLTLALSTHVWADDIRVLAAGQDVEVTFPGAGSHFTPVLRGGSLTEGSEVRTGKTGWAILSLGDKTQVELRADSDVVLASVVRSGEAEAKSRPDGADAPNVWNAPAAAAKRDALPPAPSDAVPMVVEVELRRGALAALADGTTELRVRFADGMAAANHARFAVTSTQRDHARVIVERGVAHVVASGGRDQAVPAAGQFVEINKLPTGHVVTTAQSVRSNDTEAVAEMAALRFVPTAAEPAAKPALATDTSTVSQPVASVSVPPVVAAVNNASLGQPATTTMPVSPTLATDHSSTVQTSTASIPILPSAPPVGLGIAPLNSLTSVDPLQAPANGANIKGPVNSPEHP